MSCKIRDSKCPGLEDYPLVISHSELEAMAHLVP